MNPILSIIIPVYNVEKYIYDCLVSIENQTMKDFEVILVDDGSTDKSGVICDEYEKKDNRFKVIHQKNAGSLQARREGVLISKGKYTIFIDPDDYLTSFNSLKIIVDSIEKENVDILQFYIDVEDNNKERRIGALNWLKVYPDKIKSELEIIRKCYVDNKYGWTLWNKIFKTNVVKKAAIEIKKDIKLYAATDVYNYFLIAFYSKTYIGIKTNPIYTYRRNENGITSQKKLTIDAFKHTANEINIVRLVEDFLKCQGEEYLNIYKDILEKWMKRTVGFPVLRFKELKYDDSGEGFDILVKNYPLGLLIKEIFKQYRNNEIELIKRVKGAKSLICNKRKIKTIGIFYHRLFEGGVESVISLQISMYIKMGYRVVLFTEEIDYKREYYIDKSVIRIHLPKEFFDDRADLLEKELKRQSVDIFLYHAGNSYKLIYDLILVKSLNIPFIVTRHEITVQGIPYHNKRVAIYHEVYKMADLLLVLSKMEESYYKLMGCNVKYIPNPLKKIDLTASKKINERDDIIIWVGRLDKIKNYLDALKVINEVKNTYPMVKLIIVGGEYSDGASKEIFEYIKANKLENNIELMGHVDNVDKFYKMAKIHLVTSSGESFSMVIMESKLHGIPLVTYSLPYLEILNDKRGYIEVSQGDYKAMAECVMRLFNNDELLSKMSFEAKESIKFLSEYNHEKKWFEIFENCLNKEHDYIDVNSNLKLFFENLYSHYLRGVLSYEAEINKENILIKENFGLKNNVNDLILRCKKLENNSNYIKDLCKDVDSFRVSKYLKYKILSKITFGKLRLRYRDKYNRLKNIYKKIKTIRV